MTVPYTLTLVLFSFAACLNFLKLCKIKYYNYCLIHNVQVKQKKILAKLCNRAMNKSHLNLGSKCSWLSTGGWSQTRREKLNSVISDHYGLNLIKFFFPGFPWWADVQVLNKNPKSHSFIYRCLLISSIYRVHTVRSRFLKGTSI